MAKKMCDFLLIKMRFVKNGKKREKIQILEKACFFPLSWTPLHVYAESPQDIYIYIFFSSLIKYIA